MNTETQTTSQQSATPTAPADLGELSFTDYVKVRKGGEMPASPKAPASAPADKAEQKHTGESDTSETAEELDEKEIDSEESGDESDSKEAKEDEAKDRPKKKSGYQRRIDKLNARVESERQRAESLEARLAQLEKSAGGKKEDVVTAKAPTDGKPKPDDFETHSDYVEALTEWKIGEREKLAKAEAEKAKVQTQQQKLVQTYQEKVKTFAEKTEDYTDVIESVEDIKVTPAVQQLILESDLGPELAYGLAKNRAELERINNLSKTAPFAAAREIGKIEARLNASAADQSKTEPKTLTQAPKPLATVGKGPAKVSKDINDPSLSFAEYERLRREQMKRRR